MSAVFCGLDVHKETTYATVLDQTGQGGTQRRMRNESIPEFLEPFKINWMAMEASTYIIPMYRKLTEQGYDVTVSHPKKTRLITEARIKSYNFVLHEDLRVYQAILRAVHQHRSDSSIS